VALVRIDIDPIQIVKPRKSDVALLTSSQIDLTRLDMALSGLGPRRTELWQGAVRCVRRSPFNLTP
jgi:hypothetical protein